MATLVADRGRDRVYYYAVENHRRAYQPMDENDLSLFVLLSDFRGAADLAPGTEFARAVATKEAVEKFGDILVPESEVKIFRSPRRPDDRGSV